MNMIKTINLFGQELTSVYTQTITENTAMSFNTDSRIILDTENVVLTLNFNDNNENVAVEIFAFKAATVKYYTDSTTSVDFTMDAGTSITFIYHNGWKHNGIYSAVWN